MGWWGFAKREQFTNACVQPARIWRDVRRQLQAVRYASKDHNIFPLQHSDSRNPMRARPLLGPFWAFLGTVGPSRGSLRGCLRVEWRSSWVTFGPSGPFAIPPGAFRGRPAAYLGRLGPPGESRRAICRRLLGHALGARSAELAKNAVIKES